MKERGDVIAREESRLEKRKAEKARIESSVITGIQIFSLSLRLASLAKTSHTLDKGKYARGEVAKTSIAAAAAGG